MKDFDKKKFKELMDGVSDIYNPDKKLSVVALQIYWQALLEYSFEQVSSAVTKHVTDTKSGVFYPKIADIIKHLEGERLTHDEIIASARIPKTPLGVMCRMHIGSWDLNNQTDMFYLKQRAQECLDLIPKWKEKARKGAYTDHEILTLIKYDVPVSSPFHVGISGPEQSDIIEDRANQLRLNHEAV